MSTNSGDTVSIYGVMFSGSHGIPVGAPSFGVATLHIGKGEDVVSFFRHTHGMTAKNRTETG